MKEAKKKLSSNQISAGNTFKLKRYIKKANPLTRQRWKDNPSGESTSALVGVPHQLKEGKVKNTHWKVVSG